MIYISLIIWGDIPGAKEGDVVPVFVCTTDREPTLMEPEKFSEWRWFAPEDFPNDFINLKTLELAKEYLDRHSIDHDDIHS